MAGKKINDLTALGRDLASTDLLELSLAGGTGSRKITGQQIINAIPSGITIGTTAITSGTVGRVLFEGTGNVVQESANLSWDNTNAKLLINGGFIIGADFVATSSAFKISGTDATIGIRSTSSSGFCGMNMYDNANNNIGSFQIGGTATGSPFAGNMFLGARQATGKLIFVRGVSATESMTLFSTGNFAINTTTDAGFKLDVNGTFRVASGVNALLDVTSTLTTLNRNVGTAQAMRGFSVTPTSDTRAFGTSTNYGTMSVGDGTNFAVLGYNWSPTGAKAVFAGITAAGNQLPIALYGRKFELYNQSNVAMTMFDTTANFVVQTGGTHTDVASSKFTINSTTQGFLPPRMTTTEKNAIATPAEGLQVWDTTLKLMSVYNGTAWITL